MSKILYINGNPQREQFSFGRRTGRHLLNKLKSNTSNDIEVINVYDVEIPLIDEDVLSAWGSLGNGGEFSDLTQQQQKKVGRMNELLKKFKEADEYVFTTPLWNFSVPPMVKAFIDNVMIAGETFKYTEDGPIGLLGDKKATIIQASGGVYSSGPAASMEHGVNYLQTVLAFMGIVDVSVVLVEGVAVPGKSDEERLAEAYDQIDQLFEPEYV